MTGFLKGAAKLAALGTTGLVILPLILVITYVVFAWWSVATKDDTKRAHLLAILDRYADLVRALRSTTNSTS